MCGSTRCREACRLQQARQPGGATRPPLACVSSANASTPASSSAKQAGQHPRGALPRCLAGAIPPHACMGAMCCTGGGTGEARAGGAGRGGQGRRAGGNPACQPTNSRPASLPEGIGVSSTRRTYSPCCGWRPAAASCSRRSCSSICRLSCSLCSTRTRGSTSAATLAPSGPPARSAASSAPARRARCPRPQSRPRCCRRARAAPAAASLRLRYRRRTPAVPVRLAPAHRAAARSSPP